MIVIAFEKEKIIKNAGKLTETKDSNEILKDSFRLLRFKKGNVVRKVVFIILEIFVAAIVAQQVETIEKTKSSIEIINAVIITLFGVVFTGYAFFQALINDKLLVTLLREENDGQSKLAESNGYFAQVMMLQIVCIISNICTLVFLSVLPEEWCLFESNLVNEVIAGIFVAAILHLNTECIWEIKSFIFNVVQVFNLHAFSRIVCILEKENDES